MGKKENSRHLVALGVTGCIGAYKAAELIRRLDDRGIDSHPVMTESAQQFISPLTLSTLSKRKTITGMWDSGGDWDVKHISLSDSIAALVIAPATANCLAKMACGLADDFLSTLYLATDKPVVIAPAMNSKMWSHPATRENLEKLQKRGHFFVMPGSGYLACGWEGEGRLAEIASIVDSVQYAVEENKFSGKYFVITTGPTVEDIDPMRFITNRSSGTMGIELARMARAFGANVTLISGPASKRMPYDVEVINVRSAAEMYEAVFDHVKKADVICKVAAVADYRPKNFSEEKIKKAEGPFSIELERTKDILSELAELKKRPFLLGFAAESHSVEQYAQQKLKKKNLDMIVGNNIAGDEGVVGKDTTSGVIISKDGSKIDIPKCSKNEMAREILNEISKRLNS